MKKISEISTMLIARYELSHSQNSSFGPVKNWAAAFHKLTFV